MRKNIVSSMAAVAILILVSGTAATVSGHPAGDHPPSDRPTTAAPRVSRWRANYFPNIPLVTQDGTLVRFYDDLLKDNIVVINFIYASCSDACPLETGRLIQVQEIVGERVGRDIFMYSITIDPQRDTPQVLKQYAENFRVGPGWAFLTGDKKDIDLLRKKLGLYTEATPDKPNDHTASLIIGNEATGQ
jgi:protein SCO1